MLLSVFFHLNNFTGTCFLLVLLYFMEYTVKPVPILQPHSIYSTLFLDFCLFFIIKNLFRFSFISHSLQIVYQVSFLFINLFCTDCIFSSFLISSSLMWCGIVQPLTVLKYLILVDIIPFISLALIVQDHFHTADYS
jgi:hypothetical protein